MLGARDSIATFAGTNQATCVTWAIDDVERAAQELRARGVTFEHYDFPGTTVGDDVHVEGDRKAVWFKDPDGNILSLVNELMECSEPPPQRPWETTGPLRRARQWERTPLCANVRERTLTARDRRPFHAPSTYNGECQLPPTMSGSSRPSSSRLPLVRHPRPASRSLCATVSAGCA